MGGSKKNNTMENINKGRGSTGYTKGQEKAQQVGAQKGSKALGAINAKNEALKNILGD